MAFRGRINNKYSSKICYDRVRSRRQKVHDKRIRNVKCSVDNRKPK